MSVEPDAVPEDDVSRAVRQIGNDLTHVLDMSWRSGVRDGIEMAAKIVEMSCKNPQMPAVMVGVLSGLCDTIRLSQHQIPDAAEKPTPKFGIVP